MPDRTASCYTVLEIDSSANAFEIREAYLDLVKVWHPDRFPNESHRFRRKVEEKIKAINQAYETLRAGGDAFRAESRSQPESDEGPANPNLKPMRFGDRWGYVNGNGKIVITPRFGQALPFAEGVALVCDLDRFGFIDSHGEYAIYPEFTDARSFSEGLAAVVLSTLWGYIDRRGGFQIVPSFEESREFSEQLAAVRWRGRWGFVDRGGAFVIRPQFDDALPFTGGWAEVKLGDKWGKTNPEGEVYVDGQRILLGSAA